MIFELGILTIESSLLVGYLPEDFRDSKPAAFGQDPLDFLVFLFAPGTRIEFYRFEYLCLL